MSTDGARLLVLQHQQTCPVGWVGDVLGEAGLALEVRRPFAGDPVPDSLTAWDGLLVLGGRMGATDDDVAPWLPGVRRLIARVVRDHQPYLGICLGHQLAAAALGGSVRRNASGHARGLTPIRREAAAAADPLLSAVPDGTVAVQWNNDVVTALPAGAVALATAPDGTVQAARFGPLSWGVQFHPEADGAIFRSWTVENPELDHAPLQGIDLPEVARQVADREQRLRQDWAPLVRRLAAIVTASAAQGTGPSRSTTADLPGSGARRHRTGQSTA